MLALIGKFIGRHLGACVAVLALLVAAFVWHLRSVEQTRATLAELELAGQKQLNATTVVRLTVVTAARDSLGDLLRAADQLHGTLIAGTSIKIPRRDTSYIHDTLPTLYVTLPSGELRTATFRDTTFACEVAGMVTAPPTGPLGIRYTLTRPEFHPQVGFVEVGGRMVAVVSWAGEQARIEAPYAKPVQATRWLQGFAGGWYDVSSKVVTVRAGAVLPLFWGLDLRAGLEQRIGEGGVRFLVGGEKRF